MNAVVNRLLDKKDARKGVFFVAPVGALCYSILTK